MVRPKILLQKLIKTQRSPCLKRLTTDTGASAEFGIQQRVYPKPSKTMNKYFADRGLLHILENTPTIYTRVKTDSQFYILGDPKVARRVAYEICSHLEGKYIVECDPGFGFMSDVLAIVASHLRLCEPNAEFRFRLEEFKHKFPGKVEIFDFNFHQLQIYSVSQNEYCINKIAQFFENLPESTTNEINLTFVCTMMKLAALQQLCVKLIFNQFFQKFGRWEYYWLVSSYVYEKLIASPENKFSDLYTYGAVLFQTIFDYDVLLDHLPRNVFLPWSKKREDRSEEYVLLIKAVPKLEFFNIFQNEELFANFVVFLKDNVRPKRRVITRLETYVPECGPDFIFNFDLTNYTEFVELTPGKLLAMFLSLSKIPDFLSSNRNSSTFNNDVDEMNDESDHENEILDGEGDCQTNNETDEERNYLHLCQYVMAVKKGLFVL